MLATANTRNKLYMGSPVALDFALSNLESQDHGNLISNSHVRKESS